METLPGTGPEQAQGHVGLGWDPGITLVLQLLRQEL